MNDDTASWHNLNKILLSMVIGNLSHLNSCLSSLMVSSGSGVSTSDGFEEKQHPLSLLALSANPRPYGRSAPRECGGRTGGRWRCHAPDETRGGLLCCLHSLSILWYLAAVGPLTLMSWLNSSLPSYILPMKQYIPNEGLGVQIILLFLS